MMIGAVWGKHRKPLLRGYVRNSKLDQATGKLFNLPGHSMSNMKVTILEKIHSKDLQMRKTRESFYEYLNFHFFSLTF